MPDQVTTLTLDVGVLNIGSVIPDPVGVGSSTFKLDLYVGDRPEIPGAAVG